MSDRICSYGYYKFSDFYNYCITFTANTIDETKEDCSVQYRNHIDTPQESVNNTSLQRDQLYLNTANTPVPLKNIGNTCYLNAIVQVLFMLNQVFSFGYWVSNGTGTDFLQLSNTSIHKYFAFY